MSQRRIGAAMGVDQATVSRIASGAATDISLEPAAKLLALAGGSIQWPEAANAPNDAPAETVKLGEASHVS